MAVGEEAYINLLHQIFGDRLEIINVHGDLVLKSIPFLVCLIWQGKHQVIGLRIWKVIEQATRKKNYSCLSIQGSSFRKCTNEHSETTPNLVIE